MITSSLRYSSYKLVRYVNFINSSYKTLRNSLHKYAQIL